MTKFIDLSDDICDAAFASRFAGIVASEFADDTDTYRLGVHCYGGGYLEVTRMTGSLFAVFPTTMEDGHLVRGDTERKKGEMGVAWCSGRDHAISLVRRRAERLAEKRA